MRGSDYVLCFSSLCCPYTALLGKRESQLILCYVMCSAERLVSVQYNYGNQLEYIYKS